MIQRIDLRGSSADPRTVLPRAAVDVEEATATVLPIVRDVQARGAEAVLDWTERLDGVRPAHLRVPAEEIAAAVEALDPAVRAALEESIACHPESRRLWLTAFGAGFAAHSGELGRESD